MRYMVLVEHYGFKLEQAVNLAIEGGYRPYGELKVVTTSASTLFIQAMLKVGPDERWPL